MACVFAGVPASSALDISSTHDITFLSMARRKMKSVIANIPTDRGVIKAGLQGTGAEVLTLCSPDADHL